MKTLLSSNERIIDITESLDNSVNKPTTEENSEGEYDILIQGSDRQHPAIVVRRKHRGKGATIRTISKYGRYAELYADYTDVIQSYQQRRQQRASPTTRGHPEDHGQTAREAWVDTTIESVVGGRSSDGD
jgi:hypothetical protein